MLHFSWCRNIDPQRQRKLVAEAVCVVGSVTHVATVVVGALAWTPNGTDFELPSLSKLASYGPQRTIFSIGMFVTGLLCGVFGILASRFVLKSGWHRHSIESEAERSLVLAWPLLSVVCAASLCTLAALDMGRYHGLHIFASQLFFGANFIHSCVCYYFFLGRGLPTGDAFDGWESVARTSFALSNIGIVMFSIAHRNTWFPHRGALKSLFEHASILGQLAFIGSLRAPLSLPSKKQWQARHTDCG